MPEGQGKSSIAPTFSKRGYNNTRSKHRIGTVSNKLLGGLNHLYASVALAHSKSYVYVIQSALTFLAPSFYLLMQIM